MKKIVVVAKGKRIVFTGENLNVINKGFKMGEAVTDGLVVTEKNGGKAETIAVFRRWDYWRKIPAEAPTDLVGHLMGAFGRIPIYRETLEKNPELLKTKDFTMLPPPKK